MDNQLSSQDAVQRATQHWEQEILLSLAISILRMQWSIQNESRKRLLKQVKGYSPQEKIQMLTNSQHLPPITITYQMPGVKVDVTYTGESTMQELLEKSIG